MQQLRSANKAARSIDPFITRQAPCAAAATSCNVPQARLVGNGVLRRLVQMKLTPATWRGRAGSGPPRRRLPAAAAQVQARWHPKSLPPFTGPGERSLTQDRRLGATTRNTAPVELPCALQHAHCVAWVFKIRQHPPGPLLTPQLGVRDQIA